ncbi:TldD/PmbA family protein [Texas Phoenix palm phytoplasma]|uniref:TldD/PmbA family protein n=1 Tax=Texas Phoenix palm phytoplasma TaxID=176709 RepID=A0ABS5BID0_9MOLU|nr:TldD/PmbA family protein [Texas Phoenix palm phytoplasma]MBP3059349.1 TldD/PmbA family protein [Texas Phoenix palm phytoplasma]
MLTKLEIQSILKQSLSSNYVDFAELFFEDSWTNNFKIIDKDVVVCQKQNVYGVGIRLLNKDKEFYIYTNKVTYENIINLIKEKQQIFEKEKTITPIVSLDNLKNFKSKVKKTFDSLTVEEKIKKMIFLSQIMKNFDKKIIQTIVGWEEKQQKVLIANSKGVFKKDLRPYIRISLMSVTKEGQNVQEFGESFGFSSGLEIFDNIDFKQKAIDVAKNALILLKADELKPQKMPVVLNNGFGGVIFHEACGHSLEATSVAKGLSPFCGKLNQKIASDIVTAYDDGTIQGSWGSLNFDDEGQSTQKNLLIEKGILKNYLIDFRNSLKMNMSPTGSARRQSYKYSPTSRMNSTYIEAGEHTSEQIIKDTKYGFYAQNLGGGTVQPSTGEFNFMVNLGYLIENGKLTKPIKGMMLIGSGQDILLKIDRVADDLSLSQGYCGSVSGYVPVDLGQPTIRVKEIIVGGSKK